MIVEQWRSKVLRARQHQAALLEELADLESHPPYRVTASREGNDLVLRASVQGEVPTQIALIVGDLLHNARSALDLLVYELAQRGEGALGRPPRVDEERALFFPITTNRGGFRMTAARLAPFLSPAVLSRIEENQPWMATGAGGEDGSSRGATDQRLGAPLQLHLLKRLATLNNFDKHRMILFSIWRPDSVEYGATAVTGNEEGLRRNHESAAEPITDPEIIRRLLEAIDEADQEPEAFDFFFADEPITHGAEVGRFKRNDGGLVPDDLKIQGTLRLILWEPELTDEAIGGPPVAVGTAAFIDEVERVCEWVYAGPSAHDGG